MIDRILIIRVWVDEKTIIEDHEREIIEGTLDDAFAEARSTCVAHLMKDVEEARAGQRS